MTLGFGETEAAVVLLLASPAVGSFLGVLIDRLPRGEDVIRGGSACGACGAALGWRDKMPLASYLALGGSCRHCGAKIPGWLFGVEAAALGAAALAVLSRETATEAWAASLFLWCLIALGAIDALHFRLPNPLTGALFVFGLAHAAADPARTLAEALTGAMLGAGTFWAIRVGYRALRNREGLGLGDVKLMAGIGAGIGPWALPGAVAVAASLALAGALIAALRTGRRPAADAALPFGAYLCLSAGIFAIAPWSLP